MKRTLLFSAAALVAQIASTQAAILLIIDISDPNQVKVTATAALSSGASSQRLGYEGISLLNLLKAGANIPDTSVVPSLVATSNLFPTQSPALSGGIPSRYTGLASYDFDAGSGTLGAGNDLGVYMNGGGATADSQIFTTGQRAFQGESVWDLSAYTSMLPDAGTTGNIISGYLASGNGHGVLLGEYSVIPEPSSFALGAIAASVLAIRRRRI